MQCFIFAVCDNVLNCFIVHHDGVIKSPAAWYSE